MRNLSRTTLIILIATMAVALIFLGMGKGYSQTTPPLTEKIGDLMVTFNDSTKRNEFFTIYNQQGCPANIYIHDTMWQWGSGHTGTSINVYS